MKTASRINILLGVFFSLVLGFFVPNSFDMVFLVIGIILMSVGMFTLFFSSRFKR